MLPDIAHLVYLYAIYPIYKPIEQIKFIFDKPINEIIETYTAICENPRAIRYIKKFNFSSSQEWIFLLQNPAIEVIPIIASYPNRELHHIFGNSNLEVITQVLETIGDLSTVTNLNYIRFFASCPYELTTKITLEYIKKNKDYSIFRELCKNSNPMVTEYLLEDTDKLFSSAFLFHENTNPIILEKLDQYLERANYSTRLSIISQLSYNPSAVSILKKYPELINICNLALNPNPEAYDLFTSLDYMNKLKNYEDLYDISNQLLNNHNPKMFQIYWDNIYPHYSSVADYDYCLDNPLFFELDRKSTRKLINRLLSTSKQAN